MNGCVRSRFIESPLLAVPGLGRRASRALVDRLYGRVRDRRAGLPWRIGSPTIGRLALRGVFDQRRARVGYVRVRARHPREARFDPKDSYELIYQCEEG